MCLQFFYYIHHKRISSRQWKLKTRVSWRQKIYWNFSHCINPLLNNVERNRFTMTQNNIFHIITLLKEESQVKWIYCRFFSIQFRLCVALWFIGWKLFVFILSQRLSSRHPVGAWENPIKINCFALIKIERDTKWFCLLLT